MKKTELEKLIRECVRKELVSVMPKLLKEYTRPKVVMQEATTPIDDDPFIRAQQVLKKSTGKKPKVASKTFSSDPSLNSILQDTAASIATGETQGVVSESGTGAHVGEGVDLSMLPTNQNYKAVLQKSMGTV